jgi:hypothetical protein
MSTLYCIAVVVVVVVFVYWDEKCITAPGWFIHAALVLVVNDA